jgi:hypothetical protein
MSKCLIVNSIMEPLAMMEGDTYIPETDESQQGDIQSGPSDPLDPVPK